MIFKKLLNFWMSLARLLGRVNTAVLLAVFYLLVITPMGLVMRLLGKSCLRTPARGSLWTEHRGSGDMEKQF